MKHHNLIQLSLLIALFFVGLGVVSFIMTRGPLPSRDTEAFNTYSMETQMLNVAEHNDQSASSYVSLSSQSPNTGLYQLEGSTAHDVQQFMASNPTFQLYGSGAAKQLIPDDIENIRLTESMTGAELNGSFGLNYFDNTFNHFYYAQVRCDVPVYGSYINVHVNDQSQIYALSGALMEGETSCDRKISNDEARRIAQEAFEREFKTESSYSTNESEYVLSDELVGNEGSISYFTKYVEVCSGYQCMAYFVDLRTGDIRHQVTLTYDALNREVCIGSSDTLRCTGTTRSEGESATSNELVDRGYDIMGQVYDYYQTTINRDSYNDNGGKITLIIDMSNTLNAFWYQNRITAFRPTVVDDVLMHEFTHGVTEYTAGLDYGYEPGALNESMSDVFGSMIDNNWTMGEDVQILRDMSNPPAYGHPDSLFSSRFVCKTGQPSRSNDYGGVHSNSGVFNKAFYLMSDGGTFPASNGCTINGVGRDKAIQVVYKALTTYLRNKTQANHRDVYEAVNQACADINGVDSAECQNIKAAMEATSMDQQTIGSYKGPKCTGVQQKTLTCAGGGQPPVPTGSVTPSETPSPTEPPAPPTATPTPTPIVDKEVELLSTLSAPAGVSGTVSVKQTDSDGQLNASLYISYLDSLEFASEERISLVNELADPATIQGQGVDDIPIDVKGRLIGKDVLETGYFVIRNEMDIVNEFQTHEDLSQYHTYEIYLPATPEYGELPILVADLAPETPLFEDQVVLDMKLKFQGIDRKPPSTQAQVVRIGIGGGDLNQTIYKKAVFQPGDNGIWTGRVIYNFSAGEESTGHNINVKGPKHSQKKYCDAYPTESGPGLYLCDEEAITIHNGINEFDFSGVEQPAGDINQDGIVNSVDIQLVRQNIGSSSADVVYYGDLNNDGIVNSVDDSHIIYILDNRPEQS